MSLGPIHSAKDVTLKAGQGTVPNVVEGMYDYFQKLTFTQMVKSIVNFDVVETEVSTEFFGVRQVFTPQELAMLPIGERDWKWESIHAFPTLQLVPDDRIFFNSVAYRVMKKSDYKEYGYIRYDIIQDYEETP